MRHKAAPQHFFATFCVSSHFLRKHAGSNVDVVCFAAYILWQGEARRIGAPYCFIAPYSVIKSAAGSNNDLVDRCKNCNTLCDTTSKVLND
jgi:hypothetical protein